MKSTFMREMVWSTVLAAAALPLMTQAQPARGPVELRVDNLATPLGIDDSAPRFSWQLRDPAHGARQTAYEVVVASTKAALTQGKTSVWTSGRVDSSQSMNINYKGPALAPSTRYFWRVKVWDSDGKLYPESEISWWETGLLTQDGWHAATAWIAYETPEEAAVRKAPAKWIASPDYKELAAEKRPEQHFAYRATVACCWRCGAEHAAPERA